MIKAYSLICDLHSRSRGDQWKDVVVFAIQYCFCFWFLISTPFGKYDLVSKSRKSKSLSTNKRQRFQQDPTHVNVNESISREHEREEIFETDCTLFLTLSNKYKNVDQMLTINYQAFSKPRSAIVFGLWLSFTICATSHGRLWKMEYVLLLEWKAVSI